MKLESKVAIVTGSANGIGRAVCMGFIANGARVVAVDIDEDGLRQLQRDVGTQSDNLVPINLDITIQGAQERIVESALSRWNRVDILVNNAGGSIGKRGFEITSDDWDRTLVFNLKVHFLLCQAVAPTMIAQQSGRIINVSSSGGRYRSNTGASNIAYGAAKSGLLQLTRTSAHALGRHGITVNAIAPGLILTHAGSKEFANLPDEVRDRVLCETPLGYFAEPSEIANVAIFLASDDASYITGATVMANGGWCTS